MPVPSCNPYPAPAVIMAAGIDGVKRELYPGVPINKNIFTMNNREKRRLRIGRLPANLSEALDEMEKDEVAKEALGEHVLDNYLKAKRQEGMDYISHIHPVGAGEVSGGVLEGRCTFYNPRLSMRQSLVDSSLLGAYKVSRLFGLQAQVNSTVGVQLGSFVTAFITRFRTSARYEMLSGIFMS